MTGRLLFALSLLADGLAGWGAARDPWRCGTISGVFSLTIAACIVLLGSPDPAAGAGPVGKTITVCPSDSAERDCDYTSIARAAENAEAGGTIVIRRGLYREAAVLRTPRLTILGERGAHMTGVAAEGKAALVVKGDDTVIESLECSGISVRDGNGACVRAEGRNLTLRVVYFHDSQEGILGGRGRVVIEDSIFERLGGDRATGIGRAHGIYIGEHVDELIVRRNWILASKEEGHEVKSRARRTVIEHNVIASLDGIDSRQIDLPNGGEIVIRGNVLQKGPNSSNFNFIGIGLEGVRRTELDDAENSAIIEGNTFIADRTGKVVLVQTKDVPPPRFVGNTVIGGQDPKDPANRWYRNRAAAGLAPLPHLPTQPLP